MFVGGKCIVVGVSFYFLIQNNYSSHVDDCIKIMKGSWPTFIESRITAAMPFCNVAHNIPNSQLNSESWFKVGNLATLLQTLIVSIFGIPQYLFLFQVTPFHFYRYDFLSTRLKIRASLNRLHLLSLVHGAGWETLTYTLYTEGGYLE